jgi:hypothetical protein
LAEIACGNFSGRLAEFACYKFCRHYFAGRQQKAWFLPGRVAWLRLLSGDLLFA